MRKSLLALAVLGTLSSGITYAEEAKPAEATPEWTFPANFTMVSDYIFRGQTQTWGRPAAQFSIEADHKSGFYAGLFTSNVSDQWLPGANLETDLYAGFRNKIGSSDVGYDVGAIAYLYPGANWDESAFEGTRSKKLNTAEIYGALSYQWLSVKAGYAVTPYWGWNNNNSGIGAGFNGNSQAGVKPGGNTNGSYYYEADASYEVVPTWTLSGQLGRQVVDDAKSLDITYYKAGVTKAFKDGWAVNASWSGTNEPSAYKDFLSLHDATKKYDIAKDKVFFAITKNF
jgi:uncharacterized protein (TIGR02001 family)